MFRIWIVVSLVISSSHIFGQIKESIIPVDLGNGKVQLKIIENGEPGSNLVFVHVHENETTSLQVAQEYLKSNPGRIVTLMHSEAGKVNRNVKFNIGKYKFEFDPNRIFTNDKKILKKSVKSECNDSLIYNQAIKQVDHLANIIWNQVKNYDLIIALHNNKNECATCKRKGWFGFRMEDESYNITSYVKKCDTSSESNQSCEAIYINPLYNNSEFFIVTQKIDFEKLLSRNCTVVLQNADPVDDGSMSVYAVKNNKRYINSEAKHKKYDEQLKMIRLLLGK